VQTAAAFAGCENLFCLARSRTVSTAFCFVVFNRTTKQRENLSLMLKLLGVFPLQQLCAPVHLRTLVILPRSVATAFAQETTSCRAHCLIAALAK